MCARTGSDLWGNTSTMEARVYSAAGERPAKSRRFSEKPNEIKVVASRSHVSDELRAYWDR